MGDPLGWLLWTAVILLVLFIATYLLSAVRGRRKPAEPSGLFCIPEPGAEPVEAESVEYLGRESGLHVFLVRFPISPAPISPRLRIALLPGKTRLRIMFGAEEAGLL